MSFLEDLGRAVGLGGSRPASTSLGLHSARRFRVLVERERARVHRCDDQFSLLAFAVADLRSGWPTLVKTAKILRRRLRITDDAGWLNRGTIGVLLPGTPGWGAWTMADDVCASLPLGIPLPECRVSSYPSDWLPGRSGKEDRGERARLRARRKLPAGLAEMLLVQAMPPWKRALDIAGAGLGLLLLWPLLLVVAAAVKLTSPGPVLFAQLRSGRGGKPFLMYKFRTMTTDAEARKALLLARNEQDGPAFKIKDDPRVTPLGRWLRAASIDELPQLWNVLRGDMSLVGPRPLPCEEAAACSDWRRQRLDAIPGLTCTWQVRGRSRVTFDEWTRMDIRYVRSQSWRQDLKLLLQTIPALIFHRGW